jgi:UDP-2,3-diacylglucosamine hydrolase
MSILSLSDVHIYSNKDPIYHRVLSILSWVKRERIEYLFLLGDIFDLMIGEHEEYREAFAEYFEQLEDLVKFGVKVIFVEGNHDFHLRSLYVNIGVKYHKKYFSAEIEGKKFYFAHGDEIQLKNFDYRLMKILINNPLCEKLAKLLPYAPLDKLGKNLSQASRKRNTTRYQEESSNQVKQLFRESVDSFKKEVDFDYIILGHSHVQDDYQSSLGFRYFNNGYFKLTQKPLLYKDKNFSFPNL